MSTSIGNSGPWPSGTHITVDEYVMYGGETGSSPVLLNSMFAAAETMVQDEIGTFFEPTIVTGTFLDPYWVDTRLELDYGWTRRIISATYADSRTNTSYAPTWLPTIINPRAGIILLNDRPCALGQVTIVYEAGLPEGMYKHPNMLTALTLITNELLKQVTAPETADGGPGGASIVSWSSLRYSERRQYLMRTIFGGTPIANMAFRLLTAFRSRFGGRM